MRELLAEIAIGELSPGDMLQREVDLVERFGVSRGVIRETIRGLEERGVISVKHGRGATVTPPDSWDVFDPEVVVALLDAPGGERFAAEARECQRILEVEAAGLAAERRTDEDLETISRALEEVAALASKGSRTPAAVERYRAADLAFHHAVMQASGNRALARMAEPLHRALMAARERAGAAPSDRAIAEHRKVLDAIGAGDAPKARAAMERDLTGGAGAPRKTRTS
jgi:DNA-binding FadR family transcriptional regulator